MQDSGKPEVGGNRIINVISGSHQRNGLSGKTSRSLLLTFSFCNRYQLSILEALNWR